MMLCIVFTDTYFFFFFFFLGGGVGGGVGMYLGLGLYSEISDFIPHFLFYFISH